jgi:hypothetical protein
MSCSSVLWCNAKKATIFVCLPHRRDQTVDTGMDGRNFLPSVGHNLDVRREQGRRRIDSGQRMRPATCRMSEVCVCIACAVYIPVLYSTFVHSLLRLPHPEICAKSRDSEGCRQQRECPSWQMTEMSASVILNAKSSENLHETEAVN